MKSFSQKLKFMFDIVVGLSVVLWFGYNIYHRIAHSEEYNQPLPDYNAIAKQIESIMLPTTVRDLPQPNAQERRIRPQGYTYIRYDYDNPSQKLIEKVEQNILAQNSWQEVTTRTQDSINNFKSYCNGEIALNLSNNTIHANPFSEDKDYQQLSIYMYWEQNSDCMDKK